MTICRSRDYRPTGGRRRHSFVTLTPSLADLTTVARLLPPTTSWPMYMPAPCGMSGNLCPTLQGHVQMIHVGGAEINYGLRDCLFPCPLSLRDIVDCALLFSLLDNRWYDDVSRLCHDVISRLALQEWHGFNVISREVKLLVMSTVIYKRIIIMCANT